MKKAVSRLISRRRFSSLSASSITSKFEGPVSDFYITLNEPHRTWAPGDRISGEIVLTLEKKQHCSPVLPSAKSHSSDNIPRVNSAASEAEGEAPECTIDLILKGEITVRSGATGGVKTSTLLDQCLHIYGYQNTEIGSQALDKGEHRFPFQIRLPSEGLHTSLEFERGSITYSLKGIFRRRRRKKSTNNSKSYMIRSSSQSILDNNSNITKSSTICERGFDVICPLDVAKLHKPPSKILKVQVPLTKKKKRDRETRDEDTLSSASSQEIVHSNNSDEFGIIKVIMNVPQMGYLPGEIVHVQLIISHLKPIRSLSGIVTTLSRICRVSKQSPPQSQHRSSDERISDGYESGDSQGKRKLKSKERESNSNSDNSDKDKDKDSNVLNSFQSFRKDLSQSVSPLYIDPSTMTAMINTKVKIPTDAFPTITGNNLVSFRYWIDVVIDLSGEVNINSIISTGDLIAAGFNTTGNGSINDLALIDIDKLKRHKQIVSIGAEIIVGTIRSKPPITKTHSHESASMEIRNSHSPSSLPPSPLQYNMLYGSRHYNNLNSYYSRSPSEMPPTIPLQLNPLSASPNEVTDEKELIRRHEQALLPSQPDYNVPINDLTPNAPSASSLVSHSMFPPPSDSYIDGYLTPQSSHGPTTRIPNVNDTNNDSTPNPHPDKLELEQQHLQQMEQDPYDLYGEQIGNDYVPAYEVPNEPPNGEGSSKGNGNIPIIVTDDKRELELQMLKQRESEPPEDLFSNADMNTETQSDAPDSIGSKSKYSTNESVIPTLNGKTSAENTISIKS